MEIHGDVNHDRIIDFLQKWFEDNDKLPKKIDRIVLTRFYYCMGKDIEETKKLLKIHYDMRQRSPDMFIKRDPTAEDIQKSYSYAGFLALPGLSPENYRLIILRIDDPDPKLMHFATDFKTFIVAADYRFSIPDVVIDGTPLIADGDVQIIDMENYTMKHLYRFTIRVFHSYMKYLQQAYPIRIKGLHFINCPSYMHKLIAFCKPFISKQVFEMMHFHTDGLGSLYEYVPKEMLPKEYGGNAGKLSDLKEAFIKSLLVKRNYLMDHDYWTIQK